LQLVMQAAIILNKHEIYKYQIVLTHTFSCNEKSCQFCNMLYNINIVYK